MKHKKKLVTLVALACVTVSIMGFNIGRDFMLEELYEHTEVFATTAYIPIINSEEPEHIETISASTTIVQRHLDRRTGQVNETLNRANTSLQGLTETEFSGIFSDWSILSFSANEVIMQRTIESSQQPLYKLSIFHGFLAIFNTEGRLLEVTNISINHLQEEEVERLIHGIFVRDEDELIRRLEDYSS
ncbi:MAG: hypothetical protein FWE02_07625 [Defluviitaleaceae bacterium]|nr:hypothetical protein [Defluviitaleaceae bacterium]